MRALLTRGIPAAAIIFAAGLAGFLAYRLIGGPVEPMPMATTPLSELPMGKAAPPAVAAGAAARSSDSQRTAARVIPDTLPDIAFADRSGAMRRFSDWKGQPLLVNFWATWCAPCLEELPVLERLSRVPRRDRFQVVGVAVDSRAAVLEYARREAIEYPLLIGEQPGLEAIQALGMQAVFPFSVFVDARGRIVTVKIGELRADQAKLILDRIDDLDVGRIDLATARSEIARGITTLALAHAHTSTTPKP